MRIIPTLRETASNQRSVEHACFSLGGAQFQRRFQIENKHKKQRKQNEDKANIMIERRESLQKCCLLFRVEKSEVAGCLVGLALVLTSVAEITAYSSQLITLRLYYITLIYLKHTYAAYCNRNIVLRAWPRLQPTDY